MSKAEREAIKRGDILPGFTYSFQLLGLGDCRLVVRARSREQANAYVQAFKRKWMLDGDPANRPDAPISDFRYTDTITI